MKYTIVADSHTHSCFSHDGSDSITSLCERAVEIGLYALTITDHCECNLYEERKYEQAIKNSYAETKRVADVFKGKLHLYKGIELGQAIQNLEAAESILSQCDFDFVLGSIHNNPDMQDFYLLDYSKLDVHDLLSVYFDEILKLIAWGKFDSLSHLTYPLRYIVGEQHKQVPYDVYRERIDCILKAVIEQNKALELNTSGLRQAIGKTLPCLQVIQRFRELGGKYLTVGSDAHKQAHIGVAVDEGYEIAQQAGFSHITIFVNREPVLLPLKS